MRFIRHLPKLHARRLATAATRDGLVLWGHPRFRSGRVVWMLGELGVRYTLRPIASRTHEMDCAAFVAVSPSASTSAPADSRPDVHGAFPSSRGRVTGHRRFSSCGRTVVERASLGGHEAVA